MQGNHHFQPELFAQIDYLALIPDHHLLRRIDKVLDLSFVKQITKQFYSETQGRPSIDPEVFFRICILGHIYGIKSARQLCEEVTMNIGYRWFARLNIGNTILDHSSLTRIRDRLGVGCFAAVFEQIVEQCRAAGLVPGKRIITDASLVAANASVRKLERREPPIAVEGEKHPSNRAVSPTAMMKREPVSTGTQSNPVDGEASSVAASASAQQLERREPPIAVEGEKHPSNRAVSPTAVMKRERISTGTQSDPVDGEASSVAASASMPKLERREPPIEVEGEKHSSNRAVSPTAVAKRERISNRTHVSQVDQEATLVNRAGYPMGLYHKVHYCIDASSRVITDCHVTTGARHENTVIKQRIEYQQARFGFPIIEMIADAGYSSGKTSIL